MKQTITTQHGTTRWRHKKLYGLILMFLLAGAGLQAQTILWNSSTPKASDVYLNAGESVLDLNFSIGTADLTSPKVVITLPANVTYGGWVDYKTVNSLGATYVNVPAPTVSGQVITFTFPADIPVGKAVSLGIKRATTACTVASPVSDLIKIFSGSTEKDSQTALYNVYKPYFTMTYDAGLALSFQDGDPAKTQSLKINNTDPNGKATSFTVKLTYTAGKLNFNNFKFNGTAIPAAKIASTSSTYTITFDKDVFALLGNSDDYFTKSDGDLLLSYDVMPIACGTYTVNAVLAAACQTTAAVTASVVKITPPGIPNVTRTISTPGGLNSPYLSGLPVDGVYTTTVVLKNTGTASSMNYVFTFNGYNIQYIDENTLTAVSSTGNPVGETATPTFYSTATSTEQPTKSFDGKCSNLTVTIPVIRPNETVTVTVDVHRKPWDKYSLIGLNTEFTGNISMGAGLINRTNFNDACGNYIASPDHTYYRFRADIELSSLDKVALLAKDQTKRAKFILDGGSDINNQAMPLFSDAYADADAYMEVNVYFPSTNISIDNTSGHDGIQWLGADGVEKWAGVTLTQVSATHWQAKFPRAGNSSKGVGTSIVLDLKNNLASGSVPEEVVRVTVDMITGTTRASIHKLWQVLMPIELAADLKPGVNMSNFTALRTTIGLPDNGNIRKRDASGSVDETKINKVLFTENDLMDVTWEMVIGKDNSGGSNPVDFSNLYVTMKLSTASFGMDLQQTELFVNGTSKGTVNLLGTGVNKYFDLGGLGITFKENDVVKLVSTWKTRVGITQTFDITTTAFTSHGALSNNDPYNPPVAERYGEQEDKVSGLRIVPITYATDGGQGVSRYTTFNAYNTVHTMRLGTHLYNFYAMANSFPYEFRHGYYPYEGKITVPTGFYIDDADMAILSGIGNAPLKSKVPNPDGTVTYIYDLASLINVNDLNATIPADDGFSPVIFLPLRATSTAVNGTGVPVSMTIRSIDPTQFEDKTISFSDIAYIGAPSAQLSITTPQAPAYSENMQWTFKLRNYGNVNATDVWLYLDHPLSEGISLEDMGTGAIINADATNKHWFNVGTLPAVSTTDFILRIKYSGNSCTTDALKLYSTFSYDGNPWTPTLSGAIDLTDPHTSTSINLIAVGQSPKVATVVTRPLSAITMDPANPAGTKYSGTNITMGQLFPVEMKAVSMDVASITNPVFSITYPGGILYEAGSARCEYNGSFYKLNAAGEAAMIAANGSNTPFSIDLSTMLESDPLASGLPGTYGTTAAQQSATLRFLVKTDCDFPLTAPVINAQVKGVRACDHSQEVLGGTDFTSRLAMNGLRNYSYTTVLGVPAGDLSACGATSKTLTFTIDKAGAAAIDKDSVEIRLPKCLSLVTTSVAYVTTPGSGETFTVTDHSTATANIYRWALPRTHLSGGAAVNVAYTFDVNLVGTEVASLTTAAQSVYADVVGIAKLGSCPEQRAALAAADGTINVNNLKFGLAKSVTMASRDGGNGNDPYQLTYTYSLKNTSNNEMTVKELNDDFATMFGTNATFTVGTITVPSGFTKNSSFNGTSNLNLLSGTANKLVAGATADISVVINLTPSATYNGSKFENNATVKVASASTCELTVTSSDGTDPEATTLAKTAFWPIVLKFNPTTASAQEGTNATIGFTVNRLGDAVGAADAAYTVTSTGETNPAVVGTAAAGSRVWATTVSNTAFSIAGGSTSGTITLNVVDDDVYQGPQTFNVNLGLAATAGKVFILNNAKGTITDNPTVSVSTSTSPVCNGSPATISVVFKDAKFPVTYRLTGDVTDRVTNTTPDNVQVTPTTTTTYSVTSATDVDSNPLTFTGSGAAVTVNALPTPTITPVPGTVYAGDVISYSTEAGKNTYVWTVVNGTATSPNSATTNITWGTAGATTTVKVSYADPVSGCVGTSTTHNVTVNAAVSAGSFANTALCAGVQCTGIVPTGGTNVAYYKWTGGSSLGLADYSGTDKLSIPAFTASTSGNVTITVTPYNSADVAGSTTTFTLTVHALPSVSVSHNQTPAGVCLNTDVVFTTQTGTDYVWTVDGATITAGATATSNTATLQWATAGTKTVTVNYKNSNGCQATTSSQAKISINTKPAVAPITLPAAICEGSALTLPTLTVTAQGTPVTAQTWKLNNVAYTAGTLLTYADNGKSLTFTASSACGDSIVTVGNITVNAKPTVAPITLPAAICEGSALTLPTPTVAARGTAITAQTWKLNNVAYTAGTVLTYADNGKSLTFTASSACGDSIVTVGNITVNAKPTVAPITLPAAICAGNALALPTPTVAARGTAITAQTWKLNGVAYTPGTNLAYTDNGKSLTFTASSACGDSVVTVGNITVYQTTAINTQPSVPAGIKLSNGYIIPGSIVPLSVAAVGHNLTYQWYWKKASDGSIVTLSDNSKYTGSTTASLTINNAYETENGDYYVTVTGTCNTVTSTPVTIVAVANQDASLKDLKVNGTTLSDFNPGKTDYLLAISCDDEQVTILGTPNFAGVTSLTGNGTFALQPGDNYFPITVVAQDMVTTLTYTVNVVRNCYVPKIKKDLDDAVICLNGTHTWTIEAEGENLTYEWYKGETRIMGQNTPSITFTDAKFSDYDRYYVVVRSNHNGFKSSIQSKKVRLWVADYLPEHLRLAEYPNPATVGKNYHLKVDGYVDVTKYSWSYSKSGVTFSPAVTLYNDNETWATFGSLSVGTGTLKVTMEHPCGTRELTQTITVNYPTGVDDVTATVVTVYPNPTSGMLKVSGTVANQMIRVTDVTGSLKGSYKTQEGTTTIDLTGYAKGTYLVQYNGKAYKVIRK